ncbi:MAG TPA: hypothetical protein PLK82_02290, partial [Bacteroidales bacterium]|nr:hypothetical protein [Bacteroidales bacterium]
KDDVFPAKIHSAGKYPRFLAFKHRIIARIIGYPPEFSLKVSHLSGLILFYGFIINFLLFGAPLTRFQYIPISFIVHPFVPAKQPAPYTIPNINVEHGPDS